MRDPVQDLVPTHYRQSTVTLICMHNFIFEQTRLHDLRINTVGESVLEPMDYCQPDPNQTRGCIRRLLTGQNLKQTNHCPSAPCRGVLIHITR